MCEVHDFLVIIDTHSTFTFATRLLNPMSGSMRRMMKEEIMNITARRFHWRSLAGLAMLLSLAVMVGQGVLSSLNATVSNVAPQNVNAGTMKLDLANAGNGFNTSINNMAPGDVVNRYVTLTNSGTLDGIGLSLKTAQSGTPSLINDGVSPVTTKALKLTVTECDVAWDTSNGLCGGTLSTQVASTVIGSLTTAKFFANGDMTSGKVRYLQMKIELPNQDETTVNGNLPANTIQNGSVNITYTFDLAQRVATTTNS